jgi:hypothetical protein
MFLGNLTNKTNSLSLISELLHCDKVVLINQLSNTLNAKLDIYVFFVVFFSNHFTKS